MKLSTDSPQEERQLYDVEVYNGRSLLGVITVSATSNEEASNVAIRDINVKIRRNYS
jgi:hypothetical protein